MTSGDVPLEVFWSFRSPQLMPTVPAPQSAVAVTVRCVANVVKGNTPWTVRLHWANAAGYRAATITNRKSRHRTVPAVQLRDGRLLSNENCRRFPEPGLD